jgi:hypothetical protein
MLTALLRTVWRAPCPTALPARLLLLRLAPLKSLVVL